METFHIKEPSWPKNLKDSDIFEITKKLFQIKNNNLLININM